MSRNTLARALLLILVAIFVSSTVTPAQAKPRRWAGEVVTEWKLCRNGAELTIGADNRLIRFIATSPTRFGSGHERVLAKLLLKLDDDPLTVWFEWPREDPPVVMDDSPDTPPQSNLPDGATSPFSRTVKVWWSRPAGPTVTLTMGPVDGTLTSGTLRVSNCLLLPGSWAGTGNWAQSFDALTSWLWKQLSLPWASTRG
jgi:hypothetical protein